MIFQTGVLFWVTQYYWARETPAEIFTHRSVFDSSTNFENQENIKRRHLIIFDYLISRIHCNKK